MPFLTSGGSQVGSAQINDDSIVNTDINSAAAIAQSKIAGAVGGAANIVSVETSTTFPYALTTLANQRVTVFVKGNLTAHTSQATLTLTYNAVTKDTSVSEVRDADDEDAFAMFYSEVPGAATQNVDIATSAGSLQNLRILVIKTKE